MPNFKDYCRCPGCGTCDSRDKLVNLKDDLEILRRIAERGLKLAQENKSIDIHLWQHMLYEILRARRK